MKFEQVCQTMYAYFSQKPLIKVAIPLAMPLMLIFAALRLLNTFISMDSVVHAIIFFGFLFFLILTVSACNFRMAAIGLGLYALSYAVSFLSSLIRYQNFRFSVLLYVLVYGFLAYQALRKSVA